jgi:RecB family exonuclease
MIHIFPTNRALRLFYSSFPSQNQILPKAYSIQSFFEYALHVKNLVRADSLTRTLCMQEAIDFDAFELLHITKNFMAFVRHEEYLFRFFEELSAEEVSFGALRGVDTYALYDEHLTILETVYSRYCENLSSRGFYDAITLPKYASINKDFILQSSEITLHHEGYLSNFELRFFDEIANLIPLHVKMDSTPFNRTETRRIFKTDYSSPKTFLGLFGGSQFNVQNHNFDLSIPCASFGLRSLQVGFVFDQIARFMSQGVEPENIAIVLPDEGFATLLKTYDKKRVLNFAMGISVATTPLYEKWFANYTHYNQPNQENAHRQKRFGVIEKWQKTWNEKVDYSVFYELLADFENAEKPLCELLEKQFARFERLFEWQGKIPFSDALGLFLQEIATQSLDDVGGGPVTVMGLLETRGAKFEGVIIPDFNDTFIPKRSQKDWFLSSPLRAHAGLPDRQARENLQRHYYYRVLTRARVKAVCYVQNEQSIPSNFLHIFEPKILDYDVPALTASFMPKSFSNNLINDELPTIKHQLFSYPLSASRLKTLLTCARKYYYKYIEQLRETPLPHDGLDAMEVGSAIHKAFENIYKNVNDDGIYTNKIVWKSALLAQLKNALPYSLHWELESGVWESRLENIAQMEMERFEQGWRPWKLEERFTCKYEGFPLEGQIDRIDRHEDGRLEVLDYKTGKTMQAGPTKPQNRIDFQLIFYHLLASSLGEVSNVGYFNLTQGSIEHEKSLESSLERLLDSLHENETISDFEKTTKQSNCVRCEYAQLCQRKSGWN